MVAAPGVAVPLLSNDVAPPPPSPPGYNERRMNRQLITSAAPGAGPEGTPLANMQNWYGELTVTGNYALRGAVIFDTSALTPTNQEFLPSLIPVQGRPFYGTSERATVEGTGNSISFAATQTSSSGDMVGSLNAQFIVPDPNVSSSNATIVQQASAVIGPLVVGLLDTAFADSSAVPDTLDLAGPNGRVTVQTGVTGSQGRVTYYFLHTDNAREGWNLLASLEQPVPEITTIKGVTTNDFARYPDIVSAAKYSGGDGTGSTYDEVWHAQLAGIVRSLGLQNMNGSTEETTGWGISASGAAKLVVDPALAVRDELFISGTYGEGLGHYIEDLHMIGATSLGNDAVQTGAHTLSVLPAWAYYGGYMHNWNNELRSTLSYSHVNLESVQATGQTSPYRAGEYAAVNLLYHIEIDTTSTASGKKTTTPHTFWTGVEYMFGRLETLNGRVGDDQRIEWVTAFSH
jgi:hypothetical protein